MDHMKFQPAVSVDSAPLAGVSDFIEPCSWYQFHISCYMQAYADYAHERPDKICPRPLGSSVLTGVVSGRAEQPSRRRVFF